MKKFGAAFLLAFVACSSPSNPPVTQVAASAPQVVSVPAPSGLVAASKYCRKTGGVVQVRNAWYSTNTGAQVRLNGTATFCHYRAKDKSTIDIDVKTLYSTTPTLAALAYYAEIKVSKMCRKYLADPAVCYCRQQLIGADFFTTGGSWVTAGQRPNGNNRTPFCVFSDFSVIDSWGLTYHSAGIVRGMDLSKVLRYKPA
jgi:putative hemolysin